MVARCTRRFVTGIDRRMQQARGAVVAANIVGHTMGSGEGLRAIDAPARGAGLPGGGRAVFPLRGLASGNVACF